MSNLLNIDLTHVYISKPVKLIMEYYIDEEHVKDMKISFWWKQSYRVIIKNTHIISRLPRFYIGNVSNRQVVRFENCVFNKLYKTDHMTMTFIEFKESVSIKDNGCLNVL